MKCKECKNTLKQVEKTNGYYCDSSPNVCTLSTKIIYKHKNEFGKKILSKEGTINRAMLREIIFDDGKARIKLEGIIHPEIFFNNFIFLQ